MFIDRRSILVLFAMNSLLFLAAMGPRLLQNIERNISSNLYGASDYFILPLKLLVGLFVYSFCGTLIAASFLQLNNAYIILNSRTSNGVSFLPMLLMMGFIAVLLLKLPIIVILPIFISYLLWAFKNTKRPKGLLTYVKISSGLTLSFGLLNLVYAVTIKHIASEFIVFLLQLWRSIK